MDIVVGNRALVACFLAWVLAQVSKMVIDLMRDRRFSFRTLMASGGMPSAHSASVVALATSVGIQTGLQSTSFALASVFAAVVMYDATGVRRAVSVQARILNRMLSEMLEAQQFNERRLRELIGHTPFEVFVGGLLGFLTGFTLS